MQAQQQQQQQGASPAGGALQQLAQQAAMQSPNGQPQMNGMGEQGVMPPEGMPANALPPGAGSPLEGEGMNSVNQTMVKEGEPTNRILLQQPLGGAGNAPPEEAP